MSDKQRVNLAQYRIEKAERQLTIAKKAFEDEFFDESVSKSYYSILTAMRAMLSVKGFDSQRHEGVITLFHKHFVKEGSFPNTFNVIITQLKKRREDAD